MATWPQIGVLGGGQLGRMLVLAAGKLDLPVWCLDGAGAPVSSITSRLIEGDFGDYDDVMRFGAQMDVLTIEIERVNTAALRQLQKMGKVVIPAPDVIDSIRDKGVQKLRLQQHGLPTSAFSLYPSAAAVRQALSVGKLTIPFVQKARRGGYDGRGVTIVRSHKDLDYLLDTPCLIEPLVDIARELAIIIARTSHGEVSTFPLVEMLFHPQANLVEELLAPARVTAEIERNCQILAIQTAEALNLTGLLAIELFLTHKGDILINEMAPRPHNSGHHTIEANVTSQYEQLLRCCAGLPLGDSSQRSPAVMINLLGSDDHTGTPMIEGLDASLALSGVYIHLYGKSVTKPFRKMGHATIVDADVEEALRKARFVRQTLRIAAASD